MQDMSYDVEELRGEVIHLEDVNKALEQQLVVVQTQLAEAKAENKELTDKLAYADYCLVEGEKAEKVCRWTIREWEYSDGEYFEASCNPEEAINKRGELAENCKYCCLCGGRIEVKED